MRSFIGSVEDPNIVRKACHGVTSVYHIAGVISYGTFPDFDAMERVNVQGSFCFFVLLYNIKPRSHCPGLRCRFTPV